MFDLVLSYLRSESPDRTVTSARTVTGPPRRRAVPSTVPTVIEGAEVEYRRVEDEQRAHALRRVAAMQRSLEERRSAREALTRQLEEALTEEERANPVSLPPGDPVSMPPGRSFDSVPSIH